MNLTFKVKRFLKYSVFAPLKDFEFNKKKKKDKFSIHKQYCT